MTDFLILLLLTAFLVGILIGILISYLCRDKPKDHFNKDHFNYQHETDKREALKSIAEELKTIAHLQRISMGGKSPR